MNLLQNIAQYKIILGSQSPRRQELLRGLNLDFEVKVMDVEESYPSEIIGVDIPMFLAEKKARAFNEIMDENTMVITADTIVWHEGKVLGKPMNEDDAHKMLRTLSGKTHQVITGVCISTINKRKIFHVITEVSFSKLTDSEIDFYIENYKPYDKAGSYGVQEWIGFVGVEYISGSYYNVMGLPIQRLYNELKRWK
ncbi:MAG: Maf-like protein [Paludibacter sp.]|nr:Maf-like protein [Paludibacter sp.]